MDTLEQTLKSSAAKLDGPVGGVELREYQLQLLARLREIRGKSVELLAVELQPRRLTWSCVCGCVDRLDAEGGVVGRAAAERARRGSGRARRAAEAGRQAQLPRAPPEAARAGADRCRLRVDQCCE